MTTFLHTVSRHAVQAYGGVMFEAPSAAQRDEAEYQAVYALTGALFAGGAAIVLTGLAHAFGG